MKLYELNRAIEELMQDSVDEYGEIINEQFDQRFQELKMKLNDKALNVGVIILHLEKQAQLHIEQYHKQKAIAERLKAKTQFLREYLVYNANLTPGDRLEDDRISISVRQAKPKVCVKVSVDQLPEQFQKRKETIEPDLACLEAELKNNGLDFAEMVQGKVYLVIK